MENIQFMNEIQGVFNEKKTKSPDNLAREFCLIVKNLFLHYLSSLVEKRGTQMTEKHAGRSRQCQRLQNNIKVVTHCLAWSLRQRPCTKD